jgi:hypothetical protein
MKDDYRARMMEGGQELIEEALYITGRYRVLDFWLGLGTMKDVTSQCQGDVIP